MRSKERSDKRIPFHRSWMGEEEIRAASEALRNHHVVGNGPICRRVEEQIQRAFGVKHAMLTTSCTHALEMAMNALNIGPGDEVILPSFAFPSCANAVVAGGARPVFAEIDPATLNLNPEDVQRRITPRTKAVLVVHYGGVACDMDRFLALAEQHGIYIVEDAAQAVDSRYQGRCLGTIGHVGCYSFHDTKNIACGEGGALLTQSDEIARQAEIIREKGTNRSAFLRGEVDRYTWVAFGSSYVLSDLLAAVLESQLAKAQEIKTRRKAIWTHYREALLPLAGEGLITLPTIPDSCEINYHLFFFRMKSEQERTRILRKLNAEGIAATFHFIPLHSAPFMKKLQDSAVEELEETTAASQTLVRLPLYPDLKKEDQDRIIDALKRAIDPETFFGGDDKDNG